MTNFFYSLLISSVLTIFTTMLYYEILRYTWALLPRMEIALRKRVLVVILAIFSGHTVAVWLYALAYWLLYKWGYPGDLSGSITHRFVDYLYFSVATYSSLGVGDIFPRGEFRIIAGIEVINGLVLIGWSASFTYLVMQNFWSLHNKK